MKYFFYFVIAGLLLAGCKKYLDAKPDEKLALPDSITTLQRLLDNEIAMNLNNPGTGEASADNYYLTDVNYAAIISIPQKNMYTWEADVTGTEFSNHWSRLYDIVTISNIALENIDKIIPAANEQADWNNIKGSAYLYRAKSFLTVAGLWAKAYNKTTAATDPGIPLRLSSDYQVPSRRSTVKETYDQVIADLKLAAALLPTLPKHVMRPSGVAAYGLLARTYLYMNMYDSALVYADKYLAIKSQLLNYNALSATASLPVPAYNVEVAMHTVIPAPTILSTSRARIDSNLYLQYDANDLRKTIYFKSNGNGSYAFKGSYAQSTALFNGVSTDEVYLTRAECLARSNNVSAAMTTLNNLLTSRWKTNTYINFTAVDMLTALQIILRERRKELLFRDLRWMDLKRLNSDDNFKQIVYRKLNNITYQLLPGENRYALPIPSMVIAAGTMAQNER